MGETKKTECWRKLSSAYEFKPSLWSVFEPFSLKKKIKKSNKAEGEAGRGGGGDADHTSRVLGIRVHQSGLSACGLPLDVSKFI